MLAKVLLGIAGVVVLFVAVAATRPAAYRVERKLSVAAPPELVFGVLNDLHRFSQVFVMFGSTMEKSDPQMEKTFEGPASGAGQSFAWSGKEAGKGRLTIAESVPGQKVVMNLEFVEPMASKATIALVIAGTPSGSEVTWSMEGNHNFIGKAMGVLMNMDKMMGADIEKGLAEVKTAAESKPSTARADADHE